jgi:RNA polymerase sigma-70 factor (sigma-E family)
MVTIPRAELRMTELHRSAADTTDFADVFAAHHAEALRLAYLLTGDAHRAEDVVSEAFVKVFRRWSKAGIDQPRAYIRRAVINESNSRFRRLALERREAARQRGDERGGLSADERLADQDQMFAALRRLPERQRTALVLRYYADLSERDIAEAMDVSAGTVKSSISRGLDRLRAEMGKEVQS